MQCTKTRLFDPPSKRNIKVPLLSTRVPVGPENGLEVIGRVETAVEEHHAVRCNHIHAKRPRARRYKEQPRL
eukprot:2058280-Rhodomonas_salina.1